MNNTNNKSKECGSHKPIQVHMETDTYISLTQRDILNQVYGKRWRDTDRNLVLQIVMTAPTYVGLGWIKEFVLGKGLFNHSVNNFFDNVYVGVSD